MRLNECNGDFSTVMGAILALGWVRTLHSSTYSNRSGSEISCSSASPLMQEWSGQRVLKMRALSGLGTSRSPAMRFAIVLPLLVLAVPSFSQAQSKTLHQAQSQVMSARIRCQIENTDANNHFATLDGRQNTACAACRLLKNLVTDSPKTPE